MVLDILKWAYRKYKPFCLLSYIFLMTCIIGYLGLIVYWMIHLTRLRRHKKHHFLHHVKKEHPATGKSTLTKDTKTMDFPKRNVTQDRTELDEPTSTSKPRPTIPSHEVRRTLPPASRRHLRLPRSALNKRRWRKRRARSKSWSMIDRKSSLQLDSKGNLPFHPRRDLKVEPSPRKNIENSKLSEKQIRKRPSLPAEAKKSDPKDKRFLYI